MIALLENNNAYKDKNVTDNMREAMGGGIYVPPFIRILIGSLYTENEREQLEKKNKGH